MCARVYSHVYSYIAVYEACLFNSLLERVVQEINGRRTSTATKNLIKEVHIIGPCEAHNNLLSLFCTYKWKVVEVIRTGTSRYSQTLAEAPRQSHAFSDSPRRSLALLNALETDSLCTTICTRALPPDFEPGLRSLVRSIMTSTKPGALVTGVFS